MVERVQDQHRGCTCAARRYTKQGKVDKKRLVACAAQRDRFQGDNAAEDFCAHFDRAGFCNFMIDLENIADESQRLSKEMANDVARGAKAMAEQAASFHAPQERQVKLASLALCQWNEIRLGALLGVGGFSNVYAVKGFEPCETKEGTPRLYSKEQQHAREGFSRRAQRSGDLSGRYHRILSHQTEVSERRSLETNETPRYALKHLRPLLVSKPKEFAIAASDLASEAELLLSLDHPHIVKIHGWADMGPDAYVSGRHDAFFIITDCLNETLQDRILQWRTQFKQITKEGRRNKSIVRRWAHRCLPGVKRRTAFETVRAKATIESDSLFYQRVQVAHDLSSALAYMHEKCILHRDLKPSNIGFDMRGDVKIMDFGLSRFLPADSRNAHDPQETFKMSHVGTRHYMAPEVRAKEQYNLKADVYSYGVVLWEMLAMSSPPRVEARDRSSDMRGTSSSMPTCPCWPTDIQRVVSKSLTRDSTCRPTMRIIRDHLQGALLNLAEEKEESPWLSTNKSSSNPVNTDEEDSSLMYFASETSFGTAVSSAGFCCDN